ncbi:uncharacterized protein SAPINGB_P004947 [Magnusiomyces paraingens]|uniref:Copper acquisition factor BIM1-like domain-containing protein n=1 Tax=Magnusiomyces paraingens TaxID=2606893 RepID=A0A5E8BXW0_9ASCO|nr:uncharacterized protein SAPINGB_P004947 [Saprochaete ingens]VVT56303.1 unnamed protein product [Saprochaete ingens]
MKFSATLISAASILFASSTSAQDHGEEYSQTMGPVAFLWPPDRDWSENTENVAPCGSSAQVGNRTTFPLTGGKVLLVAQDDAWDIKVAISFKSNPTSMNDFQDWFSSNITNELEVAHSCYSTPNVPSTVKAGDVGTIQLIYNAIDGSSNISHYACADVQFVDAEDFVNSGYSAFCFNTTESETSPSGTPDEISNAAASSVASSIASAASTSTAAASKAASTSSSAGAAPTFALSGFAMVAGALAAFI